MWVLFFGGSGVFFLCVCVLPCWKSFTGCESQRRKRKRSGPELERGRNAMVCRLHWIIFCFYHTTQHTVSKSWAMLERRFYLFIFIIFFIYLKAFTSPRAAAWVKSWSAANNKKLGVNPSPPEGWWDLKPFIVMIMIILMAYMCVFIYIKHDNDNPVLV